MGDSLSQSAGENPDVPEAGSLFSADEDDGVNQTDATRLEILDAVVRCFAAQGWAGTNMSLVARSTGMTRGKIQYYFPVLEDLKYAALEHLHERFRLNYFERLSPDTPPRLRFDLGIDVLWDMAREPLHLAMAEVGAAARTDSELRQRLVQIRVADEQAQEMASSASFPALAAVGRDELQLGRLFTTVFINGLAAHSFPDEPELWQARLIAMLKECLIDFWTRRGVTGLTQADVSNTNCAIEPVANGSDARANDCKDEVLTLLQQAATLLAKN